MKTWVVEVTATALSEEQLAYRLRTGSPAVMAAAARRQAGAGRADGVRRAGARRWSRRSAGPVAPEKQPRVSGTHGPAHPPSNVIAWNLSDSRRCDHRSARPRRAGRVPVDGQRLGPRPPKPGPGRTPSPDLGPPRPPGL